MIRTVSDAPNPVIVTVIVLPGGPCLGFFVSQGAIEKVERPSFLLVAPTAMTVWFAYGACGTVKVVLKVPLDVAVAVAIGDVLVLSQ